MDVARSCARIFRTSRKVSRTVRDGSTPRDVNSIEANVRLNLPIPRSNPNSIYPERTGTQEIISPRRSIIARRERNAEPLDAPINEFSAVYGHFTSLFSKLIGAETVPRESANITSRSGMELASNYALGESSKLLDLGLLPTNIADKLKSAFAPATVFEGSTDKSDWLASRHGCEEVTAGRVSEAKAFSDHITNSEFETTKIFERENDSVTRLTENIPRTQPTEYVTRLTENIPLTRPT